MTTVRRLAIGWVIVLAAPFAGGAAHAQERAISASPATVTLDASGNAEVRLTNNLGVALKLTLALVDENGAPLGGASATLTSDRPLAAGDSVLTTISVPDPPQSGSLVIVVAPAEGLPQGGVVRVPLSKTAPAEPSVTAWTLVSTHAGKDSGEHLPLTSACVGLGLSKAEKLGTVQAGGKHLDVTGSCPDPQARSVKLALPRLASDGRSYTGTITVGTTDVDLTVDDTLSWYLVAFLICFGIALAIAVGAWRGWGREATELLRTSWLIQQLVSPRNENNADASFSRAAAELNLPATVQEWTIAAAVRDRLGELRPPLRQFPTEEELQEAREHLSALELEVRQWPAVANRLAELRLASGKLVGLAAFKEQIRQRTLGREGPSLSLADMRDVRAAADEAITLANGWPAAAIQGAEQLAQTLPSTAPARIDFDAVYARLNTATNATDAEEALPDFWDVDRELRQAVVTLELAAAAMPEAGAPSWGGLFQRVETADPAETAQGLAMGLWAIDTWVFAVLLLAALVAGMQALWIDKSFGGFWDIASALVWGLGAGVVGEQLTPALSDVARSWSAAREGA